MILFKLGSVLDLDILSSFLKLIICWDLTLNGQLRIRMHVPQRRRWFGRGCQCGPSYADCPALRYLQVDGRLCWM